MWPHALFLIGNNAGRPYATRTGDMTPKAKDRSRTVCCGRVNISLDPCSVWCFILMALSWKHRANPIVSQWLFACDTNTQRLIRFSHFNGLRWWISSSICPKDLFLWCKWNPVAKHLNIKGAWVSFAVLKAASRNHYNLFLPKSFAVQHIARSWHFSSKINPKRSSTFGCVKLHTHTSNCTTSWPATPPVLATDTDRAMESPSAKEALSRLGSP